MIKQGKNNYYIVSGRNNNSQYLFEVKTKPEVLCNKPVQVYPTNYDSLYVVIDFGGFKVASGKESDSREEHNICNTTSLQFQLTANYLYISLSHPIRIILTQGRLITSTWTMNSIKEPNWIIYSSKAQRCLKAPKYNF